MSDFESFRGVPSRAIPTTPEAAGLPSDAEVIRQLRLAVVNAAHDPWGEPGISITGDGNYDPAYRINAPFRTVVASGIGDAAFRLANA